MFPFVASGFCALLRNAFSILKLFKKIPPVFSSKSLIASLLTSVFDTFGVYMDGRNKAEIKFNFDGCGSPVGDTIFSPPFKVAF